MKRLEITVDETEMSWECGDAHGVLEFRTGSSREINEAVRRVIGYFPNADEVFVNEEEA